MSQLNREPTSTFARVYEDQVWNVYGFFAYRLGSREEAEDLTQLTFERALRAWSRFDAERASARTWLLAIAHNLLVDHYRTGAAVRQEPLPDGEPGEAILGHTAPLDQELGLSPDLEAAIGALGERERELLALRFGAELSGPEIAEITGLTVANVQQILSRTLRGLRDRLEGQDKTQQAGSAGAGGV